MIAQDRNNSVGAVPEAKPILLDLYVKIIRLKSWVRSVKCDFPTGEFKRSSRVKRLTHDSLFHKKHFCKKSCSDSPLITIACSTLFEPEASKLLDPTSHNPCHILFMPQDELAHHPFSWTFVLLLQSFVIRFS